MATVVGESKRTDVHAIPVLGKIGTIFKCQLVEGKSAKRGRDKKFLATNELMEDFAKKLAGDDNFMVTGKVDGTCCLVTGGKLHKRRDVKSGRKIPDTWVETAAADKRGHRIGFMPISEDGSGDKWIRTVLSNVDGVPMIKALQIEDGGVKIMTIPIADLEGKTVEFVGPKMQGNPHGLPEHCVIPHGMFLLEGFPAGFDLDQFREWFSTDEATKFFEGVVIHFDSGELFKIHRHHLDIEWKAPSLMDIDLTC